MGSDPARGERCRLANFVFRRWKQMVEADPAKAREQPCQVLVENDQAWLEKLLDHVPDLVKGVTEAYEGITVEAFEQAVWEFFATATHPTLGLPYTKVGYQPMRELLDLLHARDFTVFICSGGGRDFMLPRYLKAVSAALTAVVLASVYVAIANPGIEPVKKIPKGLPSFAVPTGLSGLTWATLLLGACVVALVGFSEGWGAESTIASTTHDELDANQEFRAFGVGSIGTGLLGAVCRLLSRRATGRRSNRTSRPNKRSKRTKGPEGDRVMDPRGRLLEEDACSSLSLPSP